MSSKRSGYFGERRKFWTWGYESDETPQAAIDSMCERVAKRLNVPGFDLTPDPTLDEIELRAPRIEIPHTLESFCTSDKWDRVIHTYGKGYKDMAKIYRRQFDNPPDIIAYPQNEEDIAAVLDWCGENGYAAIPFGGGSSVTGGFFAPDGDEYPGVVIIDLGNMNKILEIDPVSRSARIQGGKLGPALESELKPHGLTLRHIPQSWEFSSLGGWIATRSAGHYATQLTHIDEMVQSLRIVTPSGTIQNRRLPGSGAGPDPDRTFIGSEGTMGIITEAWMRLQGRVKFRANASISFKTFYEGADAVRQITQAGLFPANARYLDEQDAFFYGAGDGTESVLLLGFESADHPVDAWLERGLEICQDYGGVVKQKAGTVDNALETSRSGAQGSWRDQFRYLPRLMHVRAAMGIVSFTFETAYTWDIFKEIDTEIMARMADAEKRITGGGIVCRRFSFLYPDGPAPYYSIMAPSTHARCLEDYQALSDVASDTLTELGATITHHHAVGRTFRPWYDKEVDPLYRKALGAIKGELDPNWIMNPGLLVDKPKNFKIVG
jgi:alkyldihydroxyacetonephosphate synthase|tara:strand:+ start:17155 stop:18807 length:1653 start_codon:yes stop_codon:yes gene_type:complete